MPITGIFGYRILPSGKIRARKAQSKKSKMDFFDKLRAPLSFGWYQASFRSRYRKVTIWALVQVESGLNLSAAVPLVI